MKYHDDILLIPLTFWLKLPLWSIRIRKIPFWVMIKVYQRFVSIQLFCKFQSNFSHRKINPKIHFDVKGGPKYPIWELSIIKALAFAGRYMAYLFWFRYGNDFQVETHFFLIEFLRNPTNTSNKISPPENMISRFVRNHCILRFSLKRWEISQVFRS